MGMGWDRDGMGLNGVGMGGEMESEWGGMGMGMGWDKDGMGIRIGILWGGNGNGMG